MTADLIIVSGDGGVLRGRLVRLAGAAAGVAALCALLSGAAGARAPEHQGGGKPHGPVVETCVDTDTDVSVSVGKGAWTSRPTSTWRSA